MSDNANDTIKQEFPPKASEAPKKLQSWLEKVNNKWVAWTIAVISGLISMWLMGEKPEIPLPPPPDFPLLPLEEQAQEDATKSTRIINSWNDRNLAEGQVEEFPYYCGVPDQVGDDIRKSNFTARPWPNQTIYYHVRVNQFRGISESQVLEAFRVAWASWAQIIDIKPVYTNDVKEAHVISQFGKIDGSGRVLAWSELSDGTTTPKQQLYDMNERWEIAEKPTQIDLVRVAAHEIGHVLGLVHDAQGSNALMAPMYSRNVRFPTELDERRILALGYGPAKKSPPPPKDPEPPMGGIHLTIPPETLIDALRKAGYSVEKK